MSFTTTRLVDNRVLVKGTDVFGTEGSEVLDSTQWDEINADEQYSAASEAFDAAVEAFFAPLLDAADQAMAATAKPEPDPITYVVKSEPVEGVPAQAGELVKLSRESIVLRIVGSADSSRLVWVNGQLEILEQQPAKKAARKTATKKS